MFKMRICLMKYITATKIIFRSIYTHKCKENRMVGSISIHLIKMISTQVHLLSHHLLNALYSVIRQTNQKPRHLTQDLMYSNSIVPIKTTLVRRRTRNHSRAKGQVTNPKISSLHLSQENSWTFKSRVRFLIKVYFN